MVARSGTLLPPSPQDNRHQHTAVDVIAVVVLVQTLLLVKVLDFLGTSLEEDRLFSFGIMPPRKGKLRSRLLGRGAAQLMLLLLRRPKMLDRNLGRLEPGEFQVRLHHDNAGQIVRVQTKRGVDGNQKEKQETATGSRRDDGAVVAAATANGRGVLADARRVLLGSFRGAAAAQQQSQWRLAALLVGVGEFRSQIIVAAVAVDIIIVTAAAGGESSSRRRRGLSLRHDRNIIMIILCGLFLVQIHRGASGKAAGAVAERSRSTVLLQGLFRPVDAAFPCGFLSG